MTPIELVLSKLTDAKTTGNGWSARCPGHEDRVASLSIAEGDDSKALLKCHAGCDTYKIVSAMGLTMASLSVNTSSPSARFKKPSAGHVPSTSTTATKPKSAAPAEVYASIDLAIQAMERRYGKHGKHTAQWTYHDEQGQAERIVLRWDRPGRKKVIRAIIRMTDGWYTSGATAGAFGWGLYRRPELLTRQGQRVYVTEGEKSAEAAWAMGLLATTSPQGSNSADNADWRPLAGREVVILPDADDAGETYAKAVTACLMRLTPPAVVKVVRLPGLAFGSGDDMVEFVQLRGGDAQAIKAELETLVAQTTPCSPPIVGGEPRLLCMNDVEPAAIAWLWPGRIALGRMTLIVGKPGDGKSFVTAFMAANVSMGMNWPDETPCPMGSVILCSAEDDPADTIAPRLIAHGADRRKIHCLTGVMMTPDEQGNVNEKVFTLADLDPLRNALERINDCKLIVIDPIGSYLGTQADANRDNEVRGVLAPTCKLAQEHGAALVVVAHTRKATAANADDMAMGSRAFTGLARSVLHLMIDPQDASKKRRLLLPGKNNLSEKAAGMAFDIGPAGVKARVNWHDGEVDMTADEAVNHETSGHGEQQTAKAEAKVFLQLVLADGPRLSKEVLAEAKEAQGISEKTLRRAVKELGLVAYRSENPGPWWWRLPALVEQMPKPPR